MTIMTTGGDFMALCPNTAAVVTMNDWFKNKGLMHSYSQFAKKGDVVFFDFNGGHSYRSHVGLVWKDNGDGTVQCIEGNTGSTDDCNGGAVMLRTRSKNWIIGYGRPEYASDSERNAFMELAYSQIGIKESPANSNNVKYNTWYYGRAVSGSAYAWCAVFVSWIFNSGNASGKTEENKVTVELTELKSGSTGAEVKTLQRILHCKYATTLSVDGEFGESTLAALKKAQGKLGINADGVCGEKTWTALLTNCS